MSVAFIGVLTILAGLIGLNSSMSVLFVWFCITCILGSASAMLIGAANILPGHLLLGFLVIPLLVNRRALACFFRQFEMGKPGFWLLLLALYGILSAFFVPRLLAGATDILPLGTTIYADTGSTVPLAPVSSNVTQSLYMTADLICFGITAALATSETGRAAVIKGLLAYSLANLIFALLDLASFYTGHQDLLSIIRNATYTMHTQETIAGLKRIVGAFPETSSFSRSTLGVLGFCGSLWLAGYRPALTGLLAGSAAVMLVLSTSSTGVAGLPVMLAVLMATGLELIWQRRLRTYGFLTLLAVPVLIVVVGLVLALDARIWQTIYNYIDMVILNKAQSDSGVERSSWNNYALQNFFDSFGMGVGLGTVRTSSFALALLAGVGIPGTLFYLAFLYGAIGRPLLHVASTKRTAQRTDNPDQATHRNVMHIACRNGCLGLLIGDLVLSPTIDQGLFFFILAGLGSASTFHARHILYRQSHRPAGALR
ncbi:hypothetical protein NAC44_13245 [Allorhizobium sp. BGMRC 0089]|uniref:hypothetical protein n=1 Tax=Allorhizobium sonneratiae TaxID=2934936 RepID=UPI0020344100|nr:hypothetical protein [Allorhizobium sonneratiae]MCM2293289.1 hypothetical protein [Allorhizobium sonneratiae]